MRLKPRNPLSETAAVNTQGNSKAKAWVRPTARYSPLTRSKTPPTIPRIERHSQGRPELTCARNPANEHTQRKGSSPRGGAESQVQVGSRHFCLLHWQRDDRPVSRAKPRAEDGSANWCRVFGGGRDGTGRGVNAVTPPAARCARSWGSTLKQRAKMSRRRWSCPRTAVGAPAPHGPGFLLPTHLPPQPRDPGPEPGATFRPPPQSIS